MRMPWKLGALMAALLLAAACGDDNGVPGDTDGSTTLPDGGQPDDGGVEEDAGVGEDDGGVQDDGGSSDDDGGTPQDDGGTGGVTVACQGKIYLCGNGVDDDGDGRADSADPDCLGPCDNNEQGFATQIPGGDSANCSRVDCYFDQDSGSGNDTCDYDMSCDPLAPEPACPYDTSCTVPEQTTTCYDVCLPLTPNGCDCFGCCDLSSDGSGDYRYIGTGVRQGSPTCNLDDIEGCAACTPVQDCFLECGRCQLCLGKTVDDLPEDCFVTPGEDGGSGGDTDGGVTNPDQCPGGEQPCGLPGQDACDPGYYCITGCCRFVG